ncbi:MAG: adenine phosphoribosyltransferase [Candidatus Methylomirabilales bacterium]
MTETIINHLKARIRDIPDFPKPGVIFKDITPLLADGEAFRSALDLLGDRYQHRGVDAVVGVEARGFIIGAALAYRLGAGHVVIRKAGKLPFRTHRAIYQLEYGTDTLEIHEDALHPGSRVVIADDVLATGGTIATAIDLVEKVGGEILELAFLVELTFLKGREKVQDYPIFSLIEY